MGARAAVMAFREETTHLMLIGYLLYIAKEFASMKVIFLSGDVDKRCDLQRLEKKCTACRECRYGMNVQNRRVAKWLGSSYEMPARFPGMLMTRLLWLAFCSREISAPSKSNPKVEEADCR